MPRRTLPNPLINQTPRRLVAVVGISLGTAVVSGCGLANSGRLETGYAYRPLGDTESERRAYYTDAYSLEALEARQSQDQDRRVSPMGPRGR